MSDTQGWTKEASDTYRQLAQIAVPHRSQQIATLLTLIPFAQDEKFKVIELASGEGRLAYSILDAFPNSTLLALDYEDSMRQETAKRTVQFADRISVEAFDMTQSDWYDLMDGADVVVSSLCIHHLNVEAKQRLFDAVYSKLSDKGALLIADLLLPQRPQANELFAATWDESAQQASLDLTGSSDVFKLFQDEQWNYYRYPDDFDKPSPLFHQLQWLQSSGFYHVDCFWMQAGHAIYGGYGLSASDAGLDYLIAFKSATKALK